MSSQEGKEQAQTKQGVPENDKAGKASTRRAVVRRALVLAALFIAGFIILGIIAVQVWDYSNSVPFCTQVCHKVHPEESEAFQDSYHADIKCTECHMGRVSTLRGIVLKAGHFRHLPEMLLGNYTRPLRSTTMRPANESCEKCHYPPAFHGDRVLGISHFAPDEANTLKQTYLILKTGGGLRSEGLGYGIHWHIENPVEFIATDTDKQQIRWVKTTLPDGRTVEYNDVVNPLTLEEIAQATKKTMDCVDCHNRVGHPFPSPETLVDQALQDGQVNKDIPYIKSEMQQVLGGAYDSRDQANAAIDALKQRYTTIYPEAAVQYAADIDQAIQVAHTLVDRLFFEQQGVTWLSFPDNAAHKDFAGCFRCHDGQHLSADGQAIRLQCNICHSIPVTVSGANRPPDMPVVTVQEPASHLATTFIADHRFQASDACAECHGEVQFGSDDSSFCASSSCHGRAWPAVNLNAAFPHPIPLTGKHAGVLCSECHKGTAKPEYKCSNCHQPPQATHFGDQCEQCHTTAGFDQADLNMANFTHPVPLDGAHATLQCTACHSGGQVLVFRCANCHQPPSQPHFGTECETCHNTTSFAGATISPDQHPVIPLIGAHARAQCTLCHPAGQDTPRYVCSNCHRAPENHFQAPCDTCHTPEGWVESAARIVQAAPKVPHDLKLGDCLACHAPTGNVKPAPADHVDYTTEQCLLCHKGAE